ncbi:MULTISPECIES: hypothetical protein [Natrialbaceae]|uniref:hypothetical protein n=1 Tax=Natrialbaceae TaxID=1644061 RepID=UPI00207C2E65|nr:hypothetical protein [Natronococcus sp. CG52]
MSLILGNGGNLVNTDGEIVFDSEEVAEALEFLDQLDEYSDESAHNSDIPGMRPPLYQGQYAMTWYSTNLAPYDVEEYNLDLEDKTLETAFDALVGKMHHSASLQRSH